MDLCPTTFRLFVVQWSTKIAGRWSQLKPLLSCIPQLQDAALFYINSPYFQE